MRSTLKKTTENDSYTSLNTLCLNNRANSWIMKSLAQRSIVLNAMLEDKHKGLIHFTK